MNFAEYRNADGGIELNRARGVYPGAWEFLPCAGGELTHRKRSPLPFREGFGAMKWIIFALQVCATFYLLIFFYLDCRAVKVEGGEVIGGGFGAADHFDGAVLAEKQLRRTQLAVVIVAH